MCCMTGGPDPIVISPSKLALFCACSVFAAFLQFLLPWWHTGVFVCVLPYCHTHTHSLIQTHTQVPAFTQCHTHSVTQLHSDSFFNSYFYSGFYTHINIFISTQTNQLIHTHTDIHIPDHT